MTYPTYLGNYVKLEYELINDEDLKLKPYTDTAGKLTIGVGRNLTDNGISKDEAMTLLQNDIDEVVSELKEQPFWSQINTNDARYRAIVNMVFNLGLPRFLEFKEMIAAIMKSDWNQAAAQIENSRWVMEVGARAIRIAQMLRTNQDPTDI